MKFTSALCLPLSVWAAWVGNPADPAALDEGFWLPDTYGSSVRLGAMGDVLFAKRLRPSAESGGLGLSNVRMQWTLAAFDAGWNVKERWMVGAIAGVAGSVETCWQRQGAVYRALGSQGVFLGASSKLILLEMKDTSLGIDARIAEILNIRGPLLENGSALASPFSSRLYFWQVGAGISQHLGPLRPYLGGVVQQLTALVRAKGMPRLRLRDLILVGAYEGCSLTLGSRCFLNVEARQFFESGISLSGEVRF